MKQMVFIHFIFFILTAESLSFEFCQTTKEKYFFGYYTTSESSNVFNYYHLKDFSELRLECDLKSFANTLPFYTEQQYNFIPEYEAFVEKPINFNSLLDWAGSGSDGTIELTLKYLKGVHIEKQLILMPAPFWGLIYLTASQIDLLERTVDWRELVPIGPDERIES